MADHFDCRELSDELEAVADGEEDVFHPAVFGERLIEAVDNAGGFILRVKGPAVHEHVIEENDSSRPGSAQDFLVVFRVADLIGVDKGEIDRSALRSSRLFSWSFRSTQSAVPAPVRSSEEHSL